VLLLEGTDLVVTGGTFVVVGGGEEPVVVTEKVDETTGAEPWSVEL
jgi:hypothetical protein